MSEQTNLPGWTFRSVPVNKAAESILVADRLINGEFSGPRGWLVRVFSAKRYIESQNEIGLFVHTPDRCWTEAGWRLEPVQPDYREVLIHGVPILFERRIFSSGSERELVYFGGLVGGQPLPYRLDHNLSVGMRHALRLAQDTTGATLRASDKRFWQRVWDSFIARRPLIGPKQFLRVSTPLADIEVAQADSLLVDFLSHWLKPVAYQKELQEWDKNDRGH
jgi:hypothetical protein